MSKTKKTSKQFPKNLRFITENKIVKYLFLRYGALFIILASIIIFLAILVVSIDLSSNFIKNQKLSGERQRIEREIKIWESVVQKYPTYRDSYFKLAVLYYQLKDFNKANKNLKKTLEIDPNFSEARELEKKITK